MTYLPTSIILFCFDLAALLYNPRQTPIGLKMRKTSLAYEPWIKFRIIARTRIVFFHRQLSYFTRQQLFELYIIIIEENNSPTLDKIHTMPLDLPISFSYPDAQELEILILSSQLSTKFAFVIAVYRNPLIIRHAVCRASIGSYNQHPGILTTNI